MISRELGKINPINIANIIAIKLNETLKMRLLRVLVTSGLKMIKIPIMIHIISGSWTK
jgi:hypothetical protein